MQKTVIEEILRGSLDDTLSRVPPGARALLDRLRARGRRRAGAWGLFALTAVTGLAAAPAARPALAEESKRIPDDLREAVSKAVARGFAYLGAHQRVDGAFEWGSPDRRRWAAADVPAWDPALTCLGVLALARGGAGLEHPTVRAALAYVRRVIAGPEPAATARDLRTTTYGASSLLWMVSELRPPGFQRAAAQAAYAIANGTVAGGLWSYALPWVVVDASDTAVASRWPNPSRVGDVSNTQFAVIGLLSAERLGIWRGVGPWARVRQAFTNIQLPDGGYGYTADPSQPDARRAAYRTATLVGAACLHLALRRTGLSREDAIEDPASRRALGWVAKHPSFESSGRWIPEASASGEPELPYYELLTLERLGVFLGEERIAGTAWYRAGTKLLLAMQGADGGWPAGAKGLADHGAVENTILAMLFLTRAIDAFSVTTPPLLAEDLGTASEIPNPLFSELVFKGVRARAAADEEGQARWLAGFTGAGPRVLGELVTILREGPREMVEDVDEVLSSLTGEPRTKGTRLDRAKRWDAWIDAHRGLLDPAKDRPGFVPRGR